MSDLNYEHHLEEIKGNAPIEYKKHLIEILKMPLPPFARNVISRSALTEVNVDEYVTGDGKRKEICTLVFELDVEKGSLLFFSRNTGVDVQGLKTDMLNAGGNLHGGCSGFMIGM
jgi:hypothetical protein